jgi:phosphoserine aminotransferase
MMFLQGVIHLSWYENSISPANTSGDALDSSTPKAHHSGSNKYLILCNNDFSIKFIHYTPSSTTDGTITKSIKKSGKNREEGIFVFSFIFLLMANQILLYRNIYFKVILKEESKI